MSNIFDDLLNDENLLERLAPTGPDMADQLFTGQVFDEDSSVGKTPSEVDASPQAEEEDSAGLVPAESSPDPVAAALAQLTDPAPEPEPEPDEPDPLPAAASAGPDLNELWKIEFGEDPDELSVGRDLDVLARYRNLPPEQQAEVYRVMLGQQAAPQPQYQQPAPQYQPPQPAPITLPEFEEYTDPAVRQALQAQAEQTAALQNQLAEQQAFWEQQQVAQAQAAQQQYQAQAQAQYQKAREEFFEKHAFSANQRIHLDRQAQTDPSFEILLNRFNGDVAQATHHLYRTIASTDDYLHGTFLASTAGPDPEITERKRKAASVSAGGQVIPRDKLPATREEREAAIETEMASIMSGLRQA